LLILKPGKFIVFGVIFMSTLHSLSHLPLSFETNVGETDPSVNFLVRGSGFTLFLTPREMVLVLTQSPTHPERDRTFPRSPDSLSPSEPTVLRLKFNGANPAAGAEGVAALPGTANYFSGNDPSRWYTDIPTFSKVRYRDLYPGIDIVYYGTQGKLEYDLIVAPGADPGMITLEFEGDGRLDRNEVGDLEFQTSQGNIAFPRPQIYQEIDQVRRRIDGRYIINDANRIGFTLADYDRNYPLVIDPELAYSTYLGGANNDRGRGIVLDSAGNAYITGYTYSSDFPTLSPLQPINHGYTEVFVTKIKADGSALLFSTYLGGADWDEAYGIALDSVGNAYITGFTYSTDFPTLNPIQPTNHGNADTFVTKIKADGSALLFSTYLGGASYDEAYGIALDSAGNAYIIGDTTSTDFPILNPIQPTRHGDYDVFITKIKADGSALLFSTYLGGSSYDVANGIALDSAGNAYITGFTYSTDFPTLNPIQPTNHGVSDAFVIKIKADGSALFFSTYLGGASYEQASGIALDSAGNAYITGFTYSTDFPTLNPLQPTNHGFYDAFVTKMKVDGSALLFATYLGGAGSDIANGIALDSAGNAYITGYTNSTDFPTLNPLQSTNHGYDAFVIKMKADGLALLFSTYLGGSGWDVANGIVVDSAGNAYITGYSNSTDFSTLNPLQPTNHGSYDAFVTKITFQVSLTVTKSAASNPVFAGDNLSYTLQVTNAGPDSATGVTLTDSLPATVNLISVQTSQGSYSQAGNTLTFQLGTLTAGASATISVVVVPTSPGAITNRAVLSSAETEPEEVSLDTAVLSSVPVLNVTMVSVPDLVRVGAVLTYSIALINQGPGVITGLSLVDILPSGMEFIAIHASQSDPPDSEEPVTYNLDLLPGGEAALVEIVVIPRISGAFTNTVSVTGNQIAAQTFSVTTTVLPALFDSGLYQIAVGKIREFVPTGSFKQDLLQLMVEVEKLRRQGRFPEAHNLTILVIQKIIRYRSRRRGQQLGLNLAVIDLRLFDQSL
jgi:uncharacterized repeat protein (TIGR01451 family)